MADDYVLDPFKNFVPRQNPPKPDKPAEPISIDITDPDALRKLCRDELVLAIRANSGKIGVVALIRELLDRLDGKPAQAINVSGQTEHNHNLTVRFVGADGKIIDNIDMLAIGN